MKLFLTKLSSRVTVYEPTIKEQLFERLKITKDIHTFKIRSDLIITNQITSNFEDSTEKSSQAE